MSSERDVPGQSGWIGLLMRMREEEQSGSGWPRQLLVALLLFGAWLVLTVMARAVVVEVGRLATIRWPSLFAGAPEFWYLSVPVWFVLTAVIVPLTCIMLDWLGAPVWHRLPGLAALVFIFAAGDASTMRTDLHMTADRIATSFVMWVCVVGAAMILTSTPPVRRILESIVLPKPWRIAIGAVAAVAFGAYFMPGMFVPPPPVPPGMYRDVTLTSLDLSDDRILARMPRDAEAVRYLEYRVVSDSGTIFVVDDQEVDAKGFARARRDSVLKMVDFSVEATGVARRMTLLTP